MAALVLHYRWRSVNRALATAIIIVVPLELGLLALWIAVGAGRQRRPHFWPRILLSALALPSLMAALVAVGRLDVLSDDTAKVVSSGLLFLGVVVLMFVPGLLYRRADSSSGPPGPDDGGGRGPGPPLPSPETPRGGVPLQDADQARARARDHSTPNFAAQKRRRPTHDPGRTPTRTNR